MIKSIYCANINVYVTGARHNFRKYNSFAVSDFGVGYDYDSVLHYSRKAFSLNGQDTLVPKQVLQIPNLFIHNYCNISPKYLLISKLKILSLGRVVPA